MIPALEFRSAEALAAHYAAVRHRLGARKVRSVLVRRELVETPEQRYARLYDTIYLEPIGPRRQPRHASKRRIDGRAKIILQNCADAYGLPADEVLGGSRKLNVVQCRHQVCWELRKHTHLSLSGIGNFLGRDHTTVLHGIRQHQARLDVGSPP